MVQEASEIIRSNCQPNTTMPLNHIASCHGHTIPEHFLIKASSCKPVVLQLLEPPRRGTLRVQSPVLQVAQGSTRPVLSSSGSVHDLAKPWLTNIHPKLNPSSLLQILPDTLMLRMPLMSNLPGAGIQGGKPGIDLHPNASTTGAQGTQK